jgi:hypothetical protein
VVTMKNAIIWDVMLCSTAEVHRRLGGTYCFHLQGRRVSQARYQQEAGGRLLHDANSDIGLEVNGEKSIGIYSCLVRMQDK